MAFNLQNNATSEEIVLMNEHIQRYGNISNFNLNTASIQEKIGFYLRKINQNSYNSSTFMLRIAKIYLEMGREKDNERWLVIATINGNELASSILTKPPKLKKLSADNLRKICNPETYHTCNNAFVDELGSRYEKGNDGIVRNNELSKQLYQIGMERGNPHSKCKIAQFNIENNPNYAKQLLITAMQQFPNFKWAYIIYSTMLQKGLLNGGIPDYNSAMMVLEQLVRNNPGYARGKFRLALFYSGEYHAMIEEHPHFPRESHNPNYIPINQEKAYNYYQQTYDKIHNSALKIAQAYDPNYHGFPGFNTDFHEKNIDTAFHYYKVASDKNDGEAIYITGLFYENVEPYANIVPVNIDKAIELYIKGSRKKDQRCIERLTVLGIPIPNDVLEALTDGEDEDF